MSQDIYFLVILRFRKIFFTTKSLIKRKRQKIKKIPHFALEKFISQVIT